MKMDAEYSSSGLGTGRYGPSKYTFEMTPNSHCISTKYDTLWDLEKFSVGLYWAIMDGISVKSNAAKTFMAVSGHFFMQQPGIYKTY